MNIFVLPISDVLPENVYLMDPKKNILMEGTFSKVIYVHSFFSMNGIYMDLPIHIQKIDNSNYFTKSTIVDTKSKTVPCSKKTVYFSVIRHNELLLHLESLEKQILEKYIPLDSNVPKIYTILQTLKSGYFRIFRDSFSKNESGLSNTNIFILKISGIWENAKGYGLSYKIVETC
jgi:hypothetical protein